MVLTSDLWEALDALDDLPETHSSDLYQRLEKAAEESTQILALENGFMQRH